VSIFSISKLMDGLRTSGGTALTAAAVLLASSGALHAEQKVTAFIQPIANYDAVWMAEAKGFLKQEGLDVTFKLFPSGTTAMQSFKAGQGDILFGGDFPGLQYWLDNNQNYRLVAAIERDPTSYLVTAKKSITKPEDLKGKTIATRVGSTVDWFMSAYLEKNGIRKDEVTIKNLDGQVMPAALCQGDIDAFFFWQPYNDKAIEVCPDKAHNLSDASGYIPGYVIMAARPEWLAQPANADATKAFLRAILKGKEVAENDLDAVAKYAKEKLSTPREAVEAKWKANNRVIALDQQVFNDYCSLAAWMRAENKLTGKFDLNKFVWTAGLEAVDKTRVSAVPGPC
jgi:NitT/TauT family transport system substrate-binding protein